MAGTAVSELGLACCLLRLIVGGAGVGYDRACLLWSESRKRFADLCGLLFWPRIQGRDLLNYADHYFGRELSGSLNITTYETPAKVPKTPKSRV